VQGNICDGTTVAAVLRDHNIDTIVHFAAESTLIAPITGPGNSFKPMLSALHIA